MPKIITAHTGVPHITSNDVGALLKAVIGDNDYLLSKSADTFKTTLLDNNTLQLSDADVVMQGTHVRIFANDKVVIEQGQSGLNRIDLVVCRYTKDENNIENAEIAVIKGTPAVNPNAPTVTQGDIRGGALLHEMPLFRIDIEEFSVTSIINLCHTVASLYDNLETVLALDSQIEDNRLKIDKIYNNKVLWTGEHYMIEDQKITIPSINSQPNGIILVFSLYSDSSPVNAVFNSFVVHKSTVTNNKKGFNFLMTNASLAYFSTKYLYISDTMIQGDDINSKTGTAPSGVTYDNSKFVLRYVIGF